MSNMQQPERPGPDATRKPWQEPTLTKVGTVSTVLEGGLTKRSVVTGDPGEPRKIPGMDK